MDNTDTTAVTPAVTDTQETPMPQNQPLPISLVVAAGDRGVYVGLAVGGARALTDAGRIELRAARHLRRYTVAGGTGTGSVSDLATRGLDPRSTSISDSVSGWTVLLGVGRAIDVADKVASSFGVSL